MKALIYAADITVWFVSFYYHLCKVCVCILMWWWFLHRNYIGEQKSFPFKPISCLIKSICSEHEGHLASFVLDRVLELVTRHWSGLWFPVLKSTWMTSKHAIRSCMASLSAKPSWYVVIFIMLTPQMTILSQLLQRERLT